MHRSITRLSDSGGVPCCIRLQALTSQFRGTVKPDKSAPWKSVQDSSSPAHQVTSLLQCAPSIQLAHAASGLTQVYTELTWTRHRPSACSKGDVAPELAPWPPAPCMRAISAADLGMAATEGITYSPCTSYLQADNLMPQPRLPAKRHLCRRREGITRLVRTGLTFHTCTKNTSSLSYNPLTMLTPEHTLETSKGRVETRAPLTEGVRELLTWSWPAGGRPARGAPRPAPT